MHRKRIDGKKILAKLGEVDKLMAQGISENRARRKLQISKQTYDRWRREFDGMEPEAIDKLLRQRQKNDILMKRLSVQTLDANAKFVLLLIAFTFMALILWLMLSTIL